MAGITTGILSNAQPISTDRVKDLEKQVLENASTFAYLNENNELCFALPPSVNGLKHFAWNTASELSVEDGEFVKRVYRRTGLYSSELEKVLHKQNVDDEWKEEGEAEATYTAGLYREGAVDLYREQGADAIADMLVTPWEELVAANAVGVIDGQVCSMAELDFGPTLDEFLPMSNIMLPDDDSITGIRTFAMTDITGIYIPDNIKRIGNDAFSTCEYLESVTIGNSVESIGNAAFSNCTSLESVTMGDSVTSIDDYAFYNCTSLNNITIGNNVTSIGESAFFYCPFTSIALPKSIKRIGAYAFSECANLTDIYYAGTLEEWNDVETGDGWNEVGWVLPTIHCTDGDVPNDNWGAS